MDYAFWREKWQTSTPGWQQTAVNPSLKSYLEKYQIAATSGTALVPLCGKSIDLCWLAKQNFQVTGVEWHLPAITAFFAEQFGQVVKPQSLNDQVSYHHQNITIYQGDFFQISQDCQFDFIYDRAAMVAIDPANHHRYIDRLVQYLKPEGHLLLLTFDHGLNSGPPFSINTDQLKQLIAGKLTIVESESQDIIDREIRFQEKGATQFLITTSVLMHSMHSKGNS